MNDRELLEAAARAAGIEPHYPFGEGEIYVRFDGLWAHRDTSDAKGALKTWNPLADDGDALRLAVKLEMSITRDARRPNLHAPGLMKYVYVAGHDAVEGAAEELGTDHDAATRRAIVRAAAAMAG